LKKVWYLRPLRVVRRVGYVRPLRLVQSRGCKGQS